MNLSPETFTVLKNFGSINSYLSIEPGRTLRTSAAAGVMARATVRETFSAPIIIHDLNQFLSVAALFNEPDFTFRDRFAKITGVGTDAKAFYLYGPPLIITTMPSNPPGLANHVIEFDLPESHWSEIQKAATVLGKKEIKVVSDGEAVHIQTFDHMNPSSHTYVMPLAAEPDGIGCEHILKLSNLQVVKGSYHFAVSAQFTMLTNTSGLDLMYWVACDPNSTFDVRASAA